MTSLGIMPEHPVASGHIVNGQPCWPVAAYVVQMIDTCLMDSAHRNWVLENFYAIRQLYVVQKAYLHVKKDKDNKIIIQKSDGELYTKGVSSEEYA